MPREHVSTPKKSKRQEFREMRQQRETRSRMITVAVIIIGALIVVGAIAVPTIQTALAPQPTARPIQNITPVVRPNPVGTAMGDPEAPVRIDVWEDFQCPACASYTSEIEPLVMEKYVVTGQVYYVFHQFPFLDDQALTKESDQAANASMCAADQGRFWDFHDILYLNWDGENEGAFSDRTLVTMAETLGLDMNAFNACFEKNQFKDEIKQDLDEGKTKGVNGTPSVFVNGQILKPGYVPSFEDISAAVDAALPQK